MVVAPADVKKGDVFASYAPDDDESAFWLGRCDADGEFAGEPNDVCSMTWLELAGEDGDDLTEADPAPSSVRRRWATGSNFDDLGEGGWAPTVRGPPPATKTPFFHRRFRSHPTARKVISVDGGFSRNGYYDKFYG